MHLFVSICNKKKLYFHFNLFTTLSYALHHPQKTLMGLSRNQTALVLLALVLVIALLAPKVASFGYSCDAFSNANFFQSVERTTPGKMWSLPDYNRFPLNSLWLRWTLSNWEFKAAAHCLQLCLVGALLASLSAVLVELGATIPIALLGGLFVLSHRTLWMSLTEIGCTHYVLALPWLLISGWWILRRGGVWIPALLAGVGSLYSEVVVFGLPMIAGFYALRSRRSWLNPTAIFYCGLAMAPFLAWKIYILTRFGRESTLWKGYGFSLGQVPLNAAIALYRILVPPSPFQCADWNFAITASGLLLALLLLVLAARLDSPPPRSPAILPKPISRMWTLCSLSSSVAVFLTFPYFKQFDRLYLLALLHLVILGTVWTAQRARLHTWTFVLALGAAVNLLGFSAKMAAQTASSQLQTRFFLAAKNSELASGQEGTFVVLYPEPYPASGSAERWGMEAFVNSNPVRKFFLGWEPLPKRSLVRFCFEDTECVVLPALSPEIAPVFLRLAPEGTLSRVPPEQCPAWTSSPPTVPAKQPPLWRVLYEAWRRM